MGRLKTGLLMSLVLLGCGDADRNLPRAYRRIAVPDAVLTSAEAQRRGARLFQEHCALCHGEGGDGRGMRREGLTSLPRDFTDRDWRMSTSPRRVYFAIREGLHGTAMPGWKSLSEPDAWDMTAHVLSLARRPRAAGADAPDGTASGSDHNALRQRDVR